MQLLMVPWLPVRESFIVSLLVKGIYIQCRKKAKRKRTRKKSALTYTSIQMLLMLGVAVLSVCFSACVPVRAQWGFYYND